MSKIAVLIPCYNEALTVAKVVRDYKEALPDSDIYVYDNNSTDGTAALAEAAGAIVRYEYRQGKGNVIRTMFRDIDADCYLVVDGDGAHPASKAKEMCDLVLNGGVDMVIGDRLSTTYFNKNKRPFHNTGNIVVRKCINLLWKRQEKIMDVMSGYRAFSPLFVKSFPVLSTGFEIETEMTIHALNNNFYVKCIPVSFENRPSGSLSKLNTFSDGFKVMLTIFNLFRNYKPLLFFGAIGIILAILAIVMFIPVFEEYILTSKVPRFPTLIVCGFTLMASILSFVCGLILDTHAVNNRKNFEVQMNTIILLLKIQKRIYFDENKL